MFGGEQTGGPPFSGAGTTSRIGPYEVLGRLGIGETSEVLHARLHGPHGFEREVVIKRLLPRCAREPSHNRMLAREAMAYARIAHPAAVRLYDFFECDGELVIVLEYVDGLSLSRLRGLLRSRRTELGDQASIYVGYRIFAALAAAHAARDPVTGEYSPVIHRDVSPGNVLVPWDGYVKLTDFGIAKISGASGDTRAGLLKGTYGYMAPEQVTGDPISVRTDVYAGCVLLRELISRRPTFQRGMPELELLRAMANPVLAPLDALRPDAPAELCDAISRGMRVDPEARTVTAVEMTNLLKGLVDIEKARAALVASVATIRDEASLSRMRRSFHTAPELDGGPTSRQPSSPFFPPATMHGRPPSTVLRASPPAVVPVALVPSEPPLGLMRDIAPPAPPSAASIARAEERRRVRLATVVCTTVAAVQIAAAVAIVRRYFAPSRAPASASATAAATPAPTGPAPAVRRVVTIDAGAAAATAPVAPVATPVVPAAPIAAAPAPTPPSTRVPAPSVPSSIQGVLTTPTSKWSHRMWLDGKYIGQSGGSLSVPCGGHTLRIGSKGPIVTVDVPCGGEVEIP